MIFHSCSAILKRGCNSKFVDILCIDETVANSISCCTLVVE